jgi:hypothetical protein
MNLLNNNMILMTYHFKDSYVEGFHSINIIIALFTLPIARVPKPRPVNAFGFARQHL